MEYLLWNKSPKIINFSGLYFFTMFLILAKLFSSELLVRGIPFCWKYSAFPRWISQIKSSFVSGKNNGSGLGLTQVQGTMKLHQGKVEYLDKNNKTTFRLSFPFNS